MNSLFKRELKELVDYMDFPTLIFNYETKRIICTSPSANEIIAKEVKNVRDLFFNMTKTKYSEELLHNGSEIFYQVNFFNGTQNILVDAEVNSITLDEMHLCIVFFDCSYKHIFDSCLSHNVPRMFWKNYEQNSWRKNKFVKKEISMEVWNRCFEEENALYREKIKNKESLHNVIKMIPSRQNKDFFIQISHLPIIDKHGIVSGELGIYHRILGREEYSKKYDSAMKEIDLSNRRQAEANYLFKELMELSKEQSLDDTFFEVFFQKIVSFFIVKGVSLIKYYPKIERLECPYASGIFNKSTYEGADYGKYAAKYEEVASKLENNETVELNGVILVHFLIDTECSGVICIAGEDENGKCSTDVTGMLDSIGQIAKIVLERQFMRNEIEVLKAQIIELERI